MLQSQLAAVQQRLARVDSAVASQQSSAALLAVAVEQLRSEQPCALQCTHGGEPSADCTHCLLCDNGWTGPECRMPAACVSVCADDAARCACDNGAAVDEMSCECACLPGWEGTTCAAVNTSVTVAEQVDFLASLLGGDNADGNVTDGVDESQTLRRMVLEARLPSTVGYGRLPVTGKLTLPLLALEAGKQRLTDPQGNGYAVPSDMVADLLPQTTELPPARHEVYPKLSDWMSKLFDWQRSQTLSPSPLAMRHSTAQTMFNAFFTAGSSLGLTAVQVPLYCAQLRSPLGSSAAVPPLTPSVQAALDYLKPFDYPASKELYRTFLSHVGTSVVVKSLVGGSIERLMRFTAGLWNDTSIGGKVRDNSFVREQLEMSWSAQTGPGAWQKNDPRFTKWVDYLLQTCRGGTSAEQNCAALKDVKAWRSALWQMPVAVTDSLVPVTRIVKDVKLQERLTRAMNDYVTEQHAAYGKAPPQ